MSISYIYNIFELWIVPSGLRSSYGTFCLVLHDILKFIFPYACLFLKNIFNILYTLLQNYLMETERKIVRAVSSCELSTERVVTSQLCY